MQRLQTVSPPSGASVEDLQAHLDKRFGFPRRRTQTFSGFLLRTPRCRGSRSGGGSPTDPRAQGRTVAGVISSTKAGGVDPEQGPHPREDPTGRQMLHPAYFINTINSNNT